MKNELNDSTWLIRDWVENEADIDCTLISFIDPQNFKCKIMHKSGIWGPWKNNQKSYWNKIGNNIEITFNEFSYYKGILKNKQITGTWTNNKHYNGNWYAVNIERKSDREIIEERKYILFYKKLGNWIQSGWRKVISLIGKVIHKETVTYQSHCWNCQAPIKARKTENKLFKWVQSKWLGNRKCKSPNCNKFLCNDCGLCFCDFNGPLRDLIRPKTKWVKI